MRLAQEWEHHAHDRTMGRIDPATERLAHERSRPLADQIADYRAAFDAAGRDATHVATTCRYLTKAAEALKWETLADVHADAPAASLAEKTDTDGLSARTHNAAVKAWRTFGAWCTRHGRLALGPFRTLGTHTPASTI